MANPGESEQQVSERIKKLAEQKGVSTKSIVTSLVADKEAKRNPITTTGSKLVSAKDSSNIKNLRKAINRNTKGG